MSENGRGRSELVIRGGELVTEVASINVPELTRAEQQTSALHLVNVVETLLDEEAARETNEFKNLETLKHNVDLVVLWLNKLAAGEVKPGEPAKQITLEGLNDRLVEALVYLFHNLPGFRNVCINAPRVSLEDKSNEHFNPLYIVFARALNKVDAGGGGEDPQITRLRTERLKMFAGTAAERAIEKAATGHRLDVYVVTNQEIKDGARALLEVLREEKAYAQDEALRAAADKVEDFLDLLSNPEHVLNFEQRVGSKEEGVHGKKVKMVELAMRTPPELGLAQLPRELYEAAKLLRRFNRRFNVACLGYNILHDELNAADFKANPLNLARSVSKKRFTENPNAMSIEDAVRLEMWDKLEPDSITLEGADLKREATSVALATIDEAETAVAAPKTKKGLVGRAWDWAKSRFAKDARDAWEREQAEEAARLRRDIIQTRIAAALISLKDVARTRSVAKLNEVRNILGILIHDDQGGNAKEYEKPELAEGFSEAIAACAEALDPAFGDYWHFLHQRLIRAREANDVVEIGKYNTLIFNQINAAIERLRRLLDNRFCYPEHVASVRDKKNYNKEPKYKTNPQELQTGVVEVYAASDGSLVSLHQSGHVLIHRLDSTTGIASESSLIFEDRKTSPTISRSPEESMPWKRVGVLAARFLPPDGKQMWVYTNAGKLKLLAYEPNNEKSVRQMLTIGSTAPLQYRWVEKRSITVGDARDFTPIFKLDGARPEFRLGPAVYDLTDPKDESERKQDAAGERTKMGGSLVAAISPEAYLTTHEQLDPTAQLRLHLKDGERVHETFEPLAVNRGDRFLVDYHGTVAAHNGQFYEATIVDHQKRLVKGRSSEQTERVLQVPSKDVYLALEKKVNKDVDQNGYRTGKYILSLKKPGQSKGVEITTIDPADVITDRPPITFARLQPDGSVIVGLRDGSIEMWDGEPMEQEPLEKRIAAVQDAIKALSDRPPSQVYRNVSGMEVITRVDGIMSNIFYHDHEHQRIVTRYRERLSLIKDGFYDTTIDAERFGALSTYLAKTEEALKKDLQLLYIADDARTLPTTRHQAYNRLKGRGEVNFDTMLERGDTIDVAAERTEIARQMEFFKLLNRKRVLVNQKKYAINLVVADYDARIKQAEREGFAIGKELDKINEVWRFCDKELGVLSKKLESETKHLHGLLYNTINIGEPLLPSDQPLSAYVKEGKLKPEVVTIMTRRIVSGQELMSDFSNIEKVTENLQNEIKSSITKMKDVVQKGIKGPRHYDDLIDELTEIENDKYLSEAFSWENYQPKEIEH